MMGKFGTIFVLFNISTTYIIQLKKGGLIKTLIFLLVIKLIVDLISTRGFVLVYYSFTAESVTYFISKSIRFDRATVNTRKPSLTTFCVLGRHNFNVTDIMQLATMSCIAFVPSLPATMAGSRAENAIQEDLR